MLREDALMPEIMKFLPKLITLRKYYSTNINYIKKRRERENRRQKGSEQLRQIKKYCPCS